jgi:D-beta-D-heptose 7-phosphate kinase/D-beta-D-heptose 1-phosphate adenosyltransferase
VSLSEKADALLGLLGRFPTKQVAVIGDLMVDCFIYGEALRLSPEAPVPVVQIKRRTTQPGGAANVAHNVLTLGGRLSLFGVLGTDDPGREVQAMLAARGAQLGGVIFDSRRPSTVKTRVVAQAQHLVRFDEEETAPIDGDVTQRLLAELQAELGALSVVVLSDYAKGLLNAELVQGCIAACRDRGIPVVADPKPVNIGIFAGVDVIKPNLGEALRLAGRERDVADGEMPALCEEVRERAGAQSVVVTAGARGVFVSGESGFTHIPALPREVYDVAGAGDSALAALALALACGAPLVDAARLGNLAGSIAVGRLGIAAVSAAELHAEIEVAYGHAHD